MSTNPELLSIPTDYCGIRGLGGFPFMIKDKTYTWKCHHFIDVCI